MKQKLFHRNWMSIAVFLVCTAYPMTVRSATVYVLVGADTSSVDNTNGGDVANSYENEFDMTPMSDGAFSTIMAPGYRNARLDSFGNSIVFTWYMLTGGWHHQATNVDAVAATRVYQESWGEESDLYGDELALHFHHFVWSGSSWGMAPTFEEKVWDFEWSISQLILDNGVFPVSFRSGWNYMDNPYQQELERWIPFRLEGDSWMSRDVPYHPSFTNYRASGDMLGWEVRHRYLGGLNQATVDQIFQWAASEGDQVTCWWSHQYESGFLSQIDNAHSYLTSADTRFPDVDFRYVTARDGMRLWQESDDLEPPTLSIERIGDSLHIQTGEDIFQKNEPYVAARTYEDEYIRLSCIQTGAGEWQTTESIDGIDLVGVAVCDDMGNTSIEILDDGSRRWSTQTELNRMQQDQVSTLQGRGDVRLVKNAANVVAEQTEQDTATQNLARSYWIAQTFTPARATLSEVRVGLTVDAAPAEILVELRTIGEGGFPDDRPQGLLASAAMTANASGLISAPLSYDSLDTGGTQYALVFKSISGRARIRLLREGTYPGGNLTRAFSLDWIHIPAFDCQFQTVDREGIVDQAHNAYDASSYVLSSAHFVTQTFMATMKSITRIETNLLEASSGDTLGIQLRRTLEDGKPDLSVAGLIDHGATVVDGAGIATLDTDWSIPTDDQGQILALTLVSPESGGDSITLAYESTGGFEPGNLYFTSDTSTQQQTGDLWFRIIQNSYAEQGILTWDFDAQRPVQWVMSNSETELPSMDTSVSLRFAFAPSQEELAEAPWTEWKSTASINLFAAPVTQWIRSQARLSTLNGEETPILDAVELHYGIAEDFARSAWILY